MHHGGQGRYVASMADAQAGLSSTGGASPRRARWPRLVLGVVLLVLGATLVLRPFTSLAFLIALVLASLVASGVGELLRGDRVPGAWPWVRCVAYLVAAGLILLWPSASIRLLAVILAVVLVLDGLSDIAAAARRRGTARYNAVVGGVASIGFGLVLLAWPDVSVLVVGVLFGARVLMAGGRQVAAFLRGEEDVPLAGGRGRGDATTAGGGWLRLTGTTLGAAVAVLLVLVSLSLQRGQPAPDAFYSAPEEVPSEPGRLLRSEPFTSAEIPAGARAWRILYTTTRDEGESAVASGLVIAPDLGEPVPVIAWAHGTTGFAQGCAPSVLDDGLAAGAMMIQDRVIEQGWAMVATDYAGLGTAGPHPYLIGEGEGRSVLDAIRAARQLTEAELADETVVWGHSQGGHAALWTGQLAPTYAPELRIAGVAALAPASNLPGLIEGLGAITGGEIFGSFVVAAYTAAYPELDAADYLRPAARIIVPELAQRCLADRSTVVSALQTLLFDRSIWTRDPNRGALATRLEENVPDGPVEAPLLIGQGADDTLITPEAQRDYVEQRCAAGHSVDYRTYPGRGHVPLVEPDSPLVPDLISWTGDRLVGAPEADSC